MFKQITSLFIGISILLNIAYSQKSYINISIVGSTTNSIKYSKYMHEDIFLDLPYYEGSVTKKIDSACSIEIDHKSELFFRVLINNQRGVILAIAPGDTVDIDIKIINDSSIKNNNPAKYHVELSKSNYLAHTIYRERFNPIAKSWISLDSVFNQYKDAELYELFEKSCTVIQKKLEIWDSLFIHNKISLPVYNLYYKDTRAGIYRHLVRYLIQRKANSRSTALSNQCDSLLRKIFDEKGGADKYLLKTYIGGRLYETYLSLKIQNSSHIKDTLLKKIYEKYYYLFDSSYREIAWGNSVLLPAILSPYNENVADKSNALVFAKYYPNSFYTKKLRSIYDSVQTVRKKASIYQEIDSTNYKSLKEIFALHSDRFFFVDVWATWCAPCIGEFAYTSQLENQLDSLNVKKIYLSIDETSDSTKWKNLIKKYYLNGSHYLVGREIQIDIIKRLLKKDEVGGLSIPQYFIYDKLHDKYYMNLSRPSSENILYEEIKKIIMN